ncbi:putative E3 ubiquitin-protein ligase UBR7 [Onthophagus taurus]|uniref:putative E3 ubiquitin-protein ligase UBR7 n=1 Tax=Onthophagus taurus TaxID=166361 RepID=UPI0039BE9B3E
MDNVINLVETQEENQNLETVTLSEVAETQQSLFADACAVLGASDDKNCTYTEGYLKRQALYACLTCTPEAKTDPTKRAGICLACTYHCHEGHELVELYTKRNFRCDCGNSKFPNFTCNLCKEKDDYNTLNTYNQNFSGVYCICSKPYPDLEDSYPDEMIQCVVCEDWLHTRHIGVEVPDNHFAEMICEECVKNHQFLLHYDGLTITKITKEKSNENNMDVIIVSDDKEKDDKDVVIIDDLVEEINKDIINNELDDKEGCKKPKSKSEKVTAKFLKDINWRTQLCNCEDCMKIYLDENVTFLTSLQDTVQFYEDKGKETVLKKEEDALNSIDRVPLMEAIAGYNDMKGHLVEYLKKFAENKKVVREEDIREFFTELDAKKKRKTAIPHFCR